MRRAPWPTAALTALLLLVVSAAPPAAAQGGTGGGGSAGQERRLERLAWDTPGTTAHLSHVAHVVGADQAWATRLTGRGVGVALVDTGVAPVQGLADVVHGPDLSLDAPVAAARHLDAYGHGTHLAGIITGDRSDARGMAPGARLVSLKVGARNGAVDVSQVIAAIDWVVQHRSSHNVRVLVLPYGTDSLHPSTVDPLAHAVETAWRAGVVVVASAGNDGQTRPHVSNPARDPFVIAVAASDTQGTNGRSDDVRPAWSAPGDASRRPDLTAPGTGIISARVPGGHLDTSYPAAIRPDGLFRGSGTSQAAAVVGGAVALLLEARPTLSPDQVKAVLLASAAPLPGHTPASGAGVLAVDAALKAAVPAGAAQGHPRSAGTGHLELSRGTHHLVDAARTRILAGDVDVHGQPFDSAAWAAAATAGTSWQGGTWNGTDWTGTGWSTTAWGGVGWNGVGWNGTSWDGVGWNATSWDGVGWNGVGWNGVGWNGIGWNGVGWNGASWNSTSWNGSSWDGVGWNGSGWSGVSWDGVAWDGVGWNGVGWNGVSWDGISWDGISWDGVGWNGVGWNGVGWNSVRWD
jgi:serine protease AprX